jgi:hypothetical protein
MAAYHASENRELKLNLVMIFPGLSVEIVANSAPLHFEGSKDTNI